MKRRHSGLIAVAVLIVYLGAGLRILAADGAVPRRPMPDAVRDLLCGALTNDVPAPRSPFGQPIDRKDEVAALRILSRLDWPDITGLQRVHYELSGPYRGEAGQVEGAWLIGRSNRSVLLLENNFHERMWRTNDASNIVSVAYQEELRPVIEAMRADRRWYTNSHSLAHGDVQLIFNHAYAAATLGYTNDAVTLVRGAEQSYGGFLKYKMQQAAAASYQTGALMLIRGEPRSRALAAWEKHREIFGTNGFPDVEEVVAVMRQQVAEFGRLTASTVENPEDLPPEQRAAYWMDRLPDAAQDRDYPRRIELVEKIVALGRAAMPALIAHLEDRRLTRISRDRTESYGMDRGPALLRVQDIALDCVERIGQVSFRPVSLAVRPFSREPAALRSDIAAEVREWWNEVKDKPPVYGRIARLEKLTIPNRIAELQNIEEVSPGAVDALALLKRWASNAPPTEWQVLATALAQRNDFSLLPRLRDRWKRGVFDDVTYLLKYGDAPDYGLLRDVEHSRSRRGEDLSTVGYSRYAFRLIDMLRRASAPATNLNWVPLLVDTLEFRRPLDEFVLQGTKDKFSAAEVALNSLILLTGHNEGFDPNASGPQRNAAIDRWLAWWQRSGETAFLNEHPETRAAFGSLKRTWPNREINVESLEPMVRVVTADRDAPIAYNVPRQDAVALARDHRMVAEGTGDALRYRFASAEAESNWWAQAKPTEATSAESNGLTTLGSSWLLGPLIDASNRTWLWQYTPEKADRDLRATIQSLATNNLVIVSNAYLLLADSKGRIWMLPHRDIPRRSRSSSNDEDAPPEPAAAPLLGFDPASGQWMERMPPYYPPAAIFTNSYSSNLFHFSSVDRVAYESSRGDLFFTDRWGVHVLRGTNWSYQPLFARELAHWTNRLSGFPIHAPEFAEDAAGRVYVWTAWDDFQKSRLLTTGFWIFDGSTWTNVTTAPLIKMLIPRPDGEVWMVGRSNQFSVLASGKLIAGDAAWQRAFGSTPPQKILAWSMGPQGTTLLQAYEGREGGTRLLVIPRVGDVHEAANPLAEALRLGRFNGLWWGASNTVWFVRRGHIESWSLPGERLRDIALPAPLAGATLRGLDAKGRIYLVFGSACWLLDPSKPLTFAGAERQMPTMEVGGTDGPWADARGRIWTAYNNMYRVLARIDGAAWTTYPQPENTHWSDFGDRFGQVLSGTNGAMLFLPDGSSSVEPASLVDDVGRVVEGEFVRLMTNYSERVLAALPPASNSVPARVIRDAAGNLWWIEDFARVSVLAGNRLITARLTRQTGHFSHRSAWLASAAPGPRVWMIGEGLAAIVELAGNEIRTVSTPVKVPTGILNAGRRSADAAGRLWLTEHRRSLALGTNGTIVATNSKPVALVDSTGSVWFHHSSGKTNVLTRERAGALTQTLSIPPPKSDVCEAPDGTFWIATADKLLHMAVRDGRLTQTESIPTPRVSSECEIACDAVGRVWVRRNESNSRRMLTCYAVKAAR